MPTTQFRPWYRVSMLRAEYGVTKPWVFARLHDGTLRGRKIGGVLLIEGQSVRELIEAGEPWRPKNAAAAR
jgi:hypothetical protein